MKKINKNLFSILFILAVCYQTVFTQPKENTTPMEIQKSIEKAYLKFDLPMLLSTYDKICQTLKTDPNNTMLIYNRAFAEYRLLAFSFDKSNAGILDKYYDYAKVHAENILSNPVYKSEGKTLLAGIYMMRIAIKKMEAPILSMKISSLVNEALEENPDNPRALYIKAIMKARTPKMYGGDIKEAVNIFQKSIMLFERALQKSQGSSDTSQKTPVSLEEQTDISWGYLETLAQFGQTQVDIDEFDGAEFIYNKALEIEPDYGWIKYELLPKLEKLKNKKKEEKNQ